MYVSFINCGLVKFKDITKRREINEFLGGKNNIVNCNKFKLFARLFNEI